MQCLVRWYLFVLVFGWVCCATAACAQEVEPQVNPAPQYSNGSTPPLSVLPTIPGREPGSPSDIIYVFDEYGKLRPVMSGLSLSLVDKLLKILNQQNPEPQYSIQSLTADGQVTDNMAYLTIQLRISTQNEPVICIPIGLKSGFFLFEMPLSQVVQYDGPSRFSIIANPQGNGYDIILRAKPVDAGSHSTPSQPAPETLEPSMPEPVDDASPMETTPESATAPETEPLPVTEVAPLADLPASLQQEFPPQGDEPATQYDLHTVTLQVVFPVTQPSIGEYQFKAEFPETLSSLVRLTVPRSDAVVGQTKGGSLWQTIPSEEQTTFVFQRASGDFEVRWHDKQYAQVRERVILQVENGNIIARVNSTGVVFDATIPVQSTGGAFDSFSLKLPQGAVFRPTQATETSEYQIEVLPPEQQDAPDIPPQAISQVLFVRLSQPTEGSVPVRIQAETPMNHSQNGLFEAGGFEVIGAEKQFGRLSVVVPQDTRLRQKESRGIRHAMEAAVNETEGIVSSFEYYEQPCSLLVQAVPQATRVSLAPEYQVEIHRNRAVLRAKLSYTIHGSLKQLAINMNGWRLTNIGPDTLVDQNDLPFMEDGTVMVTLQEPVGKNIELTLQAERFFDSDDGVVRFSFPVPEADSTEPALVAVIPDDNIELTVDESHPLVEMSQKSRRDTPLQIELPPRQQGPLVYRIDHPGKAEFCAKASVQQQKITVQSHTELTLQSDEPVKQTLDYTVEYEPITRLILAVPSELDSQGDLRVLFESLELYLFNMSEMPGSGYPQNGIVLKQVRLPDATIGKFQLALDFKLTTQIRDDLAQNLPTSTVQVKVPIVLPHDGQLVQETVQVHNPGRFQLTHDEEATGWKNVEPPKSQTLLSHSESYLTETATPLLSLGVALKNVDRSGTTTIEKGWVRSWLLGSGRVDCACYRVSTNLSHLTMKLPEETHADRIVIKIVKVNDRKVEIERNGRELRIPLISPSRDTFTDATAQSSFLWRDLPESESLHTLEIWYEVPQVTSSNSVALEMPSFLPEVVKCPMYCQVILSSSRHLLSCNPEWMPQYQWRWDGGFLSRKPDLTQQELESWVGVSPFEPISPALNSYLFITFRPESGIQLDLVDRSTLILVSSGLILLLGLILIYFPRTRYPGVLFTSLVLFVSAFAYRTTMAILFLQAGAIGIVLALIGAFLYRMFVIGDPWRGAAFGSLSSVGRKDHSRVVRRDASSHEQHSDMAGIQVVPGDQGDSDSPDSGKSPALLTNGDRSVSVRINDDVVHQADSNVTDAPIEKEGNGHV